MHGHPVWQKRGYRDIIDDYFIYLDLNNNDEWRWILANEINDTITI